MIQLYKDNNQNYDFNGDFILHPFSASLHIVLNGDWTLTVELPTQDKHYEGVNEQPVDFIKYGSVISIDYVKDKHQLYVIDSIKGSSDTIVLTCYPIFMIDSKNTVILDKVHPTNCNGQAALDSMLKYAKGFKGKSDIDKLSTCYFEKMNFMEALSGSSDNTFLKRWGGEVYYKNMEIFVMKNIGENRGLRVTYGFNMKGMEVTVDSSEVVTEIRTQGYNGRLGPGVGTSNVFNYRTAFTKFKTYSDIAFKDDVEEGTNTENLTIYDTLEGFNNALKERAFEDLRLYANPRCTYDIDMVDLSTTDKYQEFKDLLYVWIGDIVQVINKPLRIKTEQKVVELTFNCLTMEIETLVLGSTKIDYFDTFRSRKGGVA